MTRVKLPTQHQMEVSFQTTLLNKPVGESINTELILQMYGKRLKLKIINFLYLYFA